MDIFSEELEWEILREPLECCGGEKAISACLSPVNGRTLHVVVVQHELWCLMAVPID